MDLLGTLAAGVLAGLAVAMPVGPVAVHLVSLGARLPRRSAVAAALGVASVDTAYALVAASGGAGLQRWLDTWAELLSTAAGLVLVAVGLHTLVQAVVRFRRAVPTAVVVDRAAPGRQYAALVAMTAVNPATSVTLGAVALARPVLDQVGAAAVAAFGLGAGAASASWQLLLVSGGSLLGPWSASPRGQLGLGVTSGALVLALAGLLVLR